MRITWNNQENRFEAELTPGQAWISDKGTLMTAGFKCTGPPSWVWWTMLSSTLTNLKKNRPTSGLTITPEALARFTALQAAEAANTAVKDQLKIAKKALKKEQKYQAGQAAPTEDETEHGRDFDYIRTVMSKSSPCVPPVIPPPPTMLCHICQTPVYYYEQREPIPICLDCEFKDNT